MAKKKRVKKARSAKVSKKPVGTRRKKTAKKAKARAPAVDSRQDTFSMPTLDNAPRDVKALLELGRFKRRALGIMLGLRNNEETWKSFMAVDDANQAAVILDWLRHRDGKSTTTDGRPMRTAVEKDLRRSIANAGLIRTEQMVSEIKDEIY